MNLSSIKSAKQDRPFRIIALGKPKSGKSTLASQAPAPIFLPIKGEEGIDALDVQAFPTIRKYDEAEEILTNLANEKHDYKTIVIDSISTLEVIVWDKTRALNGGVDSIEKVGGGYAKGYTEALKQWRDLLNGLDYLREKRGMGCILIGHTKVEKFNDPSCEPYDRYSCDINKHAINLLTRWADGILFIMHKIVIKKEDVGFNKKQNRAIDTGQGQPHMYTQERPSHPGGGRGAWSQLPYELPLSWSVLNQHLTQQKGISHGRP